MACFKFALLAVFFSFTIAIGSYAQDRDICLTDIRNTSVLQANLKVTKGSFARSLIWPAGSTLKVRFIGGTPALYDSVRKYAVEWSQYANIRFVFIENGDAEIRVAFDEDDGNWSYLGTLATSIPQHRKTMNLGALPQLTKYPNTNSQAAVRRKVLHEFGHSLGLEHEHLSPYAGFEFNLNALYAYYAAPPNNWDKATVANNILKTIEASNTNGKYDIQSVMLYYLDPSVFKVPGNYTRYNTILSAGDKETIGLLYPVQQVVFNAIPSSRINEVRSYVSDQTGNLILYPNFTIDNATYSDCDIIIEYYNSQKEAITTNPQNACTYYFPETNQVVGYRKITPAYQNTVYNADNNSLLGISTPLSCLLDHNDTAQNIIFRLLIRANKKIIAQSDFITITVKY